MFNKGFALNTALSKAMEAKPDAVYVQNPKLVLASCVVRQYKAMSLWCPPWQIPSHGDSG